MPRDLKTRHGAVIPAVWRGGASWRRLKAGERLARCVRRRALLLGSLLLLAGVGLSGCLQGGLAGGPVPAFEVVTEKGERVNETTYLGRWLVLDLMATWCQPCKLEVEHLREVQRVHGDRVVILSIGADPTETTVDLDRFAREHGAAWSHALDFDGSMGRAMQMRIIPKLLVVDPQGVVVLEREGEVLPAAIGAAIDPSTAAPEGNVALAGPVLLALVLGVLAPFNPYRRLHRDSPRWLPTLLALALLAALVALAWPFAALVSTRATWGSLAVGALSLGAVAWWIRARRKDASPAAPQVAWEAGERAYEWGPHAAMALVLGLGGAGRVAFFAPALALLAGIALGTALRARLPAPSRDPLGLAGLLLAGLGLLAFGARILA